MRDEASVLLVLRTNLQTSVAWSTRFIRKCGGGMGGDDPSVKGFRFAFGGKGRVGGGGKLPKDGSCLS